jgi:hypothetical protein
MLERPLLLDRSPVVRNLIVVQMLDARHVGRVPLTLRPGDRLCLGLECLEDAIPLLLEDVVLDGSPLLPAFGGASM